VQNLKVDALGEFGMPLDALIGNSVAVLGIKGSGKTNTAAVLIEELLTQGLPLTIVDIEGEYWGLKERFEILVVGRSPNVDIEVDAFQAATIAEFSVLHGIPVILDLSEFSQSEMNDFLLRYFKNLWTVCFTARRPYEIILEEAHEFVPQSVRTPLKEVLTRIALRGRKRGLGIISVSQRSAKVEKDVLTQASILFLHRVVHPIDIRVYQEILPLPPKEIEAMISQLRPGQALVLSDYKVEALQIRLRHTFHVGATPELSPSDLPKLRRVDAALLGELSRLLANARYDEEDDQRRTIKRLEELVEQKELELAEQKTLNEQLKLQIDLLSKFEISLGKLPHVIPPVTANEAKVLEVDQINATWLVTQSGESVEMKDKERQVEKSDLDLIVVLPVNAQAVRKQQKRFQCVIEDLHKLPKFHRSILRFLAQREGRSMSTRELARWLDLSEATIRNRPPLELVKMGLVLRTGRRGNFSYTSTLATFLKSEFPDIDGEVLVEHLLAVSR
jgi:uncharacterized protein